MEEETTPLTEVSAAESSQSMTNLPTDTTVTSTNASDGGLPDAAMVDEPITNVVEHLGDSLRESTEKVGEFAQWISREGPIWLATDGLAILITISLALGALWLSRLVATRLTVIFTRGKNDSESRKRADTLSSVIRWLLRITIYIVAGMMVLKKLGVEIGPIIAAAGIVGLAVGFGAQNLVQDVISGFFILLEDQVRVGDVVSLNDKGGLVERITLRMIVLRDLAGNVHYVRNGQVNVITNMTKEYSHYVFDIAIAYRENVDEVIKVVKQIDEQLRKDKEFKQDILAPIEVLGLDKFDSSAVVIKARIKTKPIQQWRIGREFNRRMKNRFDELGIEIPYPHLTVYPGKDKQGTSPSFLVDLQENKPATAKKKSASKR